MITSTLRKTLIAASLVVAFGGVGMGQALAHEAGPAASPQDNATVADKTADAWITTKVKSEFATTKGVSFTNISVDTRDGVVSLSGTIGSGAEVDRAKQVAMGVKGVKGVNTSGLTVSGGTTMGSTAARNDSGAQDDGRDIGDATSDTWITTKVKSEFATTEGVSFTDISVTTRDGVVALSGTVGSGAEVDRAKQVAMSVKGVKSVDTSGLTVAAK
jgi:hyperosmotically inducible protein